jgi:hypothetical protein
MKILVARHGADLAPTYEWVVRKAEETWLHVFDRLTPRIANVFPERAIDVCFEPLFKGPQRASFDVVTLGYLESFLVVFRLSNPRYEAFEKEIDPRENSTSSGDRRRRLSGSCEERFDEYFNVFHEMVLKDKKGSGQRALKILTQVGTIAHETVADQITLGKLKQSQTFSVLDVASLVKEMRQLGDFAVFCDKILFKDLENEWGKCEADELQSLLFPLREPVPVGLAFAAGDTEWGAVLREAMLKITCDPDPEIYNSWQETVEDLGAAEIKVADEFLQSQRVLVGYEPH